MKDHHVEIERKYIILKPDIAALRTFPGYSSSEITQTYLRSEPGVARRVRRRVYADRVSYTETSKKRIDAVSAYEDEREITEAEYEDLLTEIQEGTRPIAKTRHVVPCEGTLFEIDVYPEWVQTCIMETELESEDSRVSVPGVIKILLEVTGDKKYSNAAMSRSFPKEII